MSLREIAQALRRSPSTISREIKRNSSKIKGNEESYTKIGKVNFLKRLSIIEL